MINKSLIIIPTFNERDNIDAIIEAVFNINDEFHILIVDDNSPDGTADIVRGLQNRHSGKLHLQSRKGKLGLGTAYIYGFKWALEKDYDFIFEMDADFSHDPNDLSELLNACVTDKADLAIGSRYSSGVNVVNWPMSRVLLSYCASKYVRFITGIPIHDTTAGFKCYKRSVLESIDFEKIRFTGYAFQIEMKFRAWKKGFNLTEVPVIFTDRKLGQSKMSNGIIREAIFGVILLKITSLFRK